MFPQENCCPAHAELWSPCPVAPRRSGGEQQHRDLGTDWAGELTVEPRLPQGLFVQLVKANSPASLVGLRFGDQILQIDGCDCAGWSTDRAHRVLKRASAEKIVMVVRDR